MPWPSWLILLTSNITDLLAHQSQQSAFAGGITERLRWRAQTIAASHGLSAAEEFLYVQLGAALPGQ